MSCLGTAQGCSEVLRATQRSRGSLRFAEGKGDAPDRRITELGLKVTVVNEQEYMKYGFIVSCS